MYTNKTHRLHTDYTKAFYPLLKKFGELLKEKIKQYEVKEHEKVISISSLYNNGNVYRSMQRKAAGADIKQL